MLFKRFIGSGKHLIDNIRITQAALTPFKPMQVLSIMVEGLKIRYLIY